MSAPKFEPIPAEERLAQTGGGHTLRTIHEITERNETPHAPGTWGFNIYNALTRGKDGGKAKAERFAAAVARLEDWMRWQARDRHFQNDKPPPPEAPNSYDEVAGRLWNELIDDYEGRDEVVAGIDCADGSEDFTAVGRAFIKWAEDKKVAKDRKNVRNDQCLIMDDKALQTIEALPAKVPELKYRDWQERTLIDKYENSAWLWILDREYMRRRESGERLGGGWVEPGSSLRKPYPPWARMQIGSAFDLWFKRPTGGVPISWSSVIREDREKWDTVLWWGGVTADMFNTVYRDERKRKLEEESRDEDGGKGKVQRLAGESFVELDSNSSPPVDVKSTGDMGESAN